MVPKVITIADSSKRNISILTETVFPIREINFKKTKRPKIANKEEIDVNNEISDTLNPFTIVKKRVSI